MSHGVPRSDEESPNRCGGSRTGLETDGAEAALSGLPHHGLGPSDPDAEEAGPGATVLGVANGGHPGQEGGQRHGEPGRLLDGEIREGGSNAPADPQLCFASHRGSQLCDGRGPRVDGSTTNMCPSRTRKQGPNYGRMFWRCPMARGQQCRYFAWTQVQPNWKFHRQPSDSNIAEVYGTEDTRTCTAGRLRAHPLSHDQSRDECLCPTGEVRDLRQGAEERGQEGIGHGVCSIQQVAGFQGVQEEGADQGAPEDDTRGDRRVRGVPEVPSLAATSQGTELGIECEESQDVPRALKGLNEDENVLEDTTELTKQAERALHQAEAALRTAEVAWKELMSLVCTEPDQVESAGWKRFQQEVLDPKDPSKVRNSKALYKFAHVLGTDKDQAKVVAEVFNPNRFGPQTKRHGLVKGQSFDLELGTDLLEPRNQEMVLEYLNYVQPGLTAISPPCTLFTILQNLNHARRTEEYLQRLRWAKELLRFATKVALLVMSYGGKFLLENPLTSKAWQEKYLNELMMDERVHLAVADQCMYGLTSIQEAPQRKPTGFTTNSEKNAKELGQRCDGQHRHEPVLGSDQGGLRSKQTQVYPKILVDAILRGYRKEMKLNFQERIHWTQFAELQQQEEKHVARLDLLRLEADEILVDYAVHALGEEDLLADGSGQGDGDDSGQGEGNDQEVVGGDDLDEMEDEEEEAGRRKLPRERPFSLPQLVRRAHEGLGHPSNDRLARILRNAKASPEAIRIAKEMRCSVCEKHQKVKPPRNAAPPRMLQVNETVGVDTVYLPHPDGRSHMALNIVDWASRFQMIIPLTRHTPGAARQAYLQWVKLFGPPEKLF